MSKSITNKLVSLLATFTRYLNSHIIYVAETIIILFHHLPNVDPNIYIRMFCSSLSNWNINVAINKGGLHFFSAPDLNLWGNIGVLGLLNGLRYVTFLGCVNFQIRKTVAGNNIAPIGDPQFFVGVSCSSFARTRRSFLVSNWLDNLLVPTLGVQWKLADGTEPDNYGPNCLVSKSIAAI